MPLKAAQRWLPVLLLSLAFILCLTRFAWLRADFPNHSPWMRDSAKYTDEGWWANAAVRHFVVGHWEVAGDYNPAAVVPVWPALLTLVFEFTGVSITAARAVNVGFSAATVVLLYLLIRRYGGTQTTAAVAAVLLAASPFAFVFSRLATLDTIVVFEWVLMVWAASHADREHRWPLPLLGLVMGATVLTKTTSLALLPAIFWLLWKRNLRALLTGTALAGVVLGLFPFRPAIQIRRRLSLLLQHQRVGRCRPGAHRFAPAAVISQLSMDRSHLVPRFAGRPYPVGHLVAKDMAKPSVRCILDSLRGQRPLHPSPPG
jgi:4-amino-4-deoxy-L-arabinose transferase-like glycosyltransferase